MPDDDDKPDIEIINIADDASRVAFMRRSDLAAVLQDPKYSAGFRVAARNELHLRDHGIRQIERVN